MGFVYRFVFPNGKMYVGQTTKADVRKRWHLHRVRANNSWAVANAIRKHGWESIKKEVLLEIADELLNHYEAKFIDLLGTLRPGGYNLTPGGDFNPMNTEHGRARQLESVRSTSHRASQGKHSRDWHKNQAMHNAWASKNAISNRSIKKRLKLSNSTRSSWENSEVRTKRTEGLKRAFQDESTSAKRKKAAAKALRTAEASANMMAGHARAREAKLAKLPPAEREKKRADMEKRRNKAREKYRAKHGITHRVVAQ